MKSKIIIVFSIFLIILLILIKVYLFSHKYTSDDAKKEYRVFIESIKSKSDKKVAYNVKLLNTNDEFILNIYDNSYDSVQTDLTKYSNYKYGDVIKVKGKISIPQKLNNPGEFNYKLYLYSNNIHGLINTYEIPNKVEYTLNFVENIYSKIYMFKSHVQNIIQTSMSQTNANVAMSIIYGDTTELDENIKEEFESIGISHLMSVSGTHITSFMIVITLMFRINNKQNKQKNRKSKVNNKLQSNKNIIKQVIQIIGICLYITFTGFSISVVRAGIMLIISIICDMLNISKNKYKAMLITLLIILIINPYVIFNTGMSLSFLATLGIILFSKHITKLFERLANNIKKDFVKNIVTYIIDNIAITISVQIMIIPIQIQTFNKLPFPVVIPNLIMGMISTPIRVLGTVGIILSFVPFLSCKIFSVIEIFIKILLKVSNVFKTISFSVSMVSMPVVFFVLYYIFVLSIFVYFKIKNIQDINIKNNNNILNKDIKFNKSLKYIKIFVVTLAILLIAIVILLNIYSIYFSEYVYFFNVEQGDMSYVKSGSSSVIVDIGSMSNNLAFNTISNYFKISNLERVNAVIISHMHKDHINGLEHFLQKYKVGTVIYSKPKTITQNYTDFEQILTKYNVNKEEVKGGDIIELGKIKIQILLPEDEYIESDDEENANSLICKITVEDKQLLYMGDASAETERKLLQQGTDTLNLSNMYVLKVGHHGSKTATSNEFIQTIQPQNAVISALKKYYGHPHEQTINTLKENNVYTYLTEKQGAIKFSLK